MKIGILGAGQLARMLALAAYPLGIHCYCFDPVPDASASSVAPVITAAYDDWAQLERFAQQVDVITCETEHIPLATLELVSRNKAFYPGLLAIQLGQDRYQEKSLFQHLQLPTPRFMVISTREELTQAVTSLGLPLVLKTRRFGYDGKGQVVIKLKQEVQRAWDLLGGHELIAEEYISFERELSLIAVRGKKGEVQFYPLVENYHQAGILRVSRAPYHDATLQHLAETYLQQLLTELNYVGVLVVEFFQVGGQLLLNEMAPRVHNSGHWTIEGAITSQFANHVRAIAGLPLGVSQAQGYSAMFNIIGKPIELASLLQLAPVHYHTYEKAPRPHRKLGHITLAMHEKDFYEYYYNLMHKYMEQN